MVEGYKPQDFSFFHRGGKISTTEKGDENILLPMVLASLRSDNSAEQEAAIMVIEEWRTKECLDAISNVPRFSSDIIADYAKMVTDELKQELGEC